MYRVVKPTGFNVNIVVENTDTRANIIIGRLTPTIMSILEKNGYTDLHSTGVTDEWKFEVNKETAIELVHEAMKIVKPKRDQSKKPTEDKKEIKMTAGVDAFDLIYGI